MFEGKVVVTIDVGSERIYTDLLSEPEAFDAIERTADRVEQWTDGLPVGRVTITLTVRPELDREL